jgi:hypothetical protein
VPLALHFKPLTLAPVPVSHPDTEPGIVKNEKQRQRMARRKRAQDKLNDTREELFRGEWDG